jgi:hypothetical protein
MLRLRTLSTFLLLTLGSVTAGEAQDRSRPFLDISMGPSFRAGAESIKGVYYQRGSGFGLLSLGAQPHVDRSFIFALRGGFIGIPSSGDVCRLTPDYSACYQNFPLTGIIALTAGARLPSARGALEMTIGPALLGHYEDHSSFGLLMAARVGTLPGSYFSIGVAFFGVLTTIEGTPVPVGGLGINLRSW